jgi:hypothetical protein
MKMLVAFLAAVLFPLGAMRADDALASEASGRVLDFSGVVTAVDSNGNAPGHCFTAQDAEGKVKVFRISSLDDLAVGKRVALKYDGSDRYPLAVKTVRFLPPEKL